MMASQQVSASAPATPLQLRITPRAAALTIRADATLEDPYRQTWNGAAPRLRRHGGAVEIDYAIGGRVRAASTRGRALTLALNPAVAWAIELCGGVSGLRADLRDLRVAGLRISGGARDVVVELPEPREELEVRVEGGLSGAVVRRPATTPVSVEIDGGASGVRLDAAELGPLGGTVRRRTAGDPASAGEVVLRVLGGASELTVEGGDDGDPEPAAPAAPRADEAAVRALFGAMLDGWNRGDGEAFAAPFADRVDFIAFDGTHLTSREEIVTVHQELFDTWLKGTRLTGDVAVRFLTADVALLVARGGTVMRGKAAPAPERDSIQTLTAVRATDGWRLASFQNTRTRPIGERVTGALLWFVTDKLWRWVYRPTSSHASPTTVAQR